MVLLRQNTEQKQTTLIISHLQILYLLQYVAFCLGKNYKALCINYLQYLFCLSKIFCDIVCLSKNYNLLIIKYLVILPKQIA